MNNFFLTEARKGNVFHSHNTTAGAFTVIHATCTGLILDNPYGSGKDLIVESASFAGSTLDTIRQMGLGVGPTLSTVGIPAAATLAVIHNAKLSGSNVNIGKARTYSIATLPNTPVWLDNFSNARVTNAVNGLVRAGKSYEGTLIVAPGFYICIVALTKATTGLGSFTWAEVPVL